MKTFGILRRNARAAQVVVLLSAAHLLSACSTTALHGENNSNAASQTAIVTEGPGTAADLSDSGSDLEGLPLEVNRSVLYWIDYFQGRGRPHMERYLSRSTRYMPAMKEILKKEGLPEDLIYIALIESGFSSTAHSHANAVGYWQFIRGTGKHYGLQIDSYVDERRDFIKSTKAAAEYFKSLYNLFGVWYLAIASYNVGENRVKSLVMKYHTRDFWQLARENKLPEETINYVPKFLAARLIAKEPAKYGFVDIEYLPALEFAEVDFSTSVDLKKLAQGMGLEFEELRDLNPAYKRGVAFEKDGKLTLRVPKGTETAAVAAATTAVAESRRTYASDDYTYYRVRRGDTISTLARRFSTSQQNIRTLNNIGRGSKLYVGKRIRVPGEPVAGLGKRQVSKTSSKKNAELAVTRSPSQDAKQAASKAERQVYVVRKGDTLIDIARKYQVTLKQLTSHNQLNRKAKIPIGAKLEIP